MFSVIIPLYNKAPYIEKAIHSVLNQTHKEFEVIVIDDGSVDNGVEIVKQMSSSTNQTIKLIEQTNQGVSTARNNGVKLAKYDYIAFLDADDWWSPTFLQEMKLLIEEFPHAGIYGSSYFKVKKGKKLQANIGVDKGFENGEINYFKVYAKTLWMPLWTGAIVVPKIIIENENGFKPQLKLGEDFDLWVRIAEKHSVVFLNKPLSNYNQDVEVKDRAVGEKLYYPKEHMLFSNYGALMKNGDFKFLFEKLALYGLLPYYMNNKNKEETAKILRCIDWSKHELKYRLYYNFFPTIVLKIFFLILKQSSKVKSLLK